MENKLKVVQMLPALESGGVERGTLEIGAELVRRGHRSVVISGGGRMVAELAQQGSEHLTWDVGSKRLSTLRWIPRLRRYLRASRPDILHLRSRLPAWIGYLAWRGLPPGCRPHLVTTVHGPYRINRYSAVMTKGERVIAVSAMIRNYVLGNYPTVDPDRVRVIHRGVERTQYPYGYRPAPEWLDAWKQQYPQLENAFVITLPGRLTRWKGQEDFIDIIGQLKGRGLPVKGLLVGDAHPRKRAFEEELRNKTSRAGLDNEIIFVGHRTDLREIMSVSGVVLSLSTQPEAFGRTTIEALSLGIPVAGYAHGGVEEQLLSVLPGGLVSVGDVASVADLLFRWFHRPPEVAVEHDFTLQNMLDQTLSLYSELVSMPTKR